MAPPRKPAEELAARRMVYSPGHPLCLKAPYVPEHRLVLYGRIGPGPHPCHWCGASVEWRPGGRTRTGALVAAHLDGNERNNDPANLVPACHRCNVRDRAYTVRDDEPHITRPDGIRVRAVRRTCAICGGEFLFVPADKRPGRGRFCSRSCARKAPRKQP